MRRAFSSRLLDARRVAPAQDCRVNFMCRFGINRKRCIRAGATEMHIGMKHVSGKEWLRQDHVIADDRSMRPRQAANQVERLGDVAQLQNRVDPA